MEGIYGNDIALPKSSGHSTDGALIYYNNDSPFELIMTRSTTLGQNEIECSSEDYE